MPNNEDRTYFVLCQDNCRFESMTKEQIIAAISDATGLVPESIDIDAAFISKIKEQNANKQLKFWVGTTAQFIALETKDANTLYILTDDDTAQSLDDIEDTAEEIAENIEKILNGQLRVKKAECTEITDAEFITLSIPAEGIECPFENGKTYMAYIVTNGINHFSLGIFYFTLGNQQFGTWSSPENHYCLYATKWDEAHPDADAPILYVLRNTDEAEVTGTLYYKEIK